MHLVLNGAPLNLGISPGWVWFHRGFRAVHASASSVMCSVVSKGGEVYLVVDLENYEK